jgi:hypothetical protein
LETRKEKEEGSFYKKEILREALRASGGERF